MTAIRIEFLAVLSALALMGAFGTDACRANPTPLTAGRKALLFQASSDIQLSSFNGATISLKRHTSPGGAWRFGMTTFLSAYDQEYGEDVVYDDPPSPTTSVREEDRDEIALSIAVERLRYLTPERRISFFYGLGPALSVSRRNYKSRVSQLSISTSENSSYGIGVGAVLGVEWFPHDQIGILGQYGSSLSYIWKKTESENRQSGQTRTSRTEAREFAFRADIVRLGISVYW